MVRKFEEKDAIEVSEMIAKTLRTVNIKDYSEEFIEKTIKSLSPEKLIERSKWTHFYVVHEDGKIIGCGAIGPYWNSLDESSFFTIFVLPEYQGKGIGRKILETLEKDMFFLRARRIEIPASITACSFYRKMGYEYKNGITEIDDEQLYRLEKYRDIIIRNIVETDIPAVVDIQFEGWKTAYKGIIEESYLNSMNKKEREQKRKNDYNKSLFIVATLNNEVVGFCRYSENVISTDGEDCDCEVMSLYVKPELKQQGIGKTLLNYAKSDLRNKGKRKMVLWCLKENYPSRRFYEKMGGKIIGEHDIEIGEKVYGEVGFGFNL